MEKKKAKTQTSNKLAPDKATLYLRCIPKTLKLMFHSGCTLRNLHMQDVIEEMMEEKVKEWKIK